MGAETLGIGRSIAGMQVRMACPHQFPIGLLDVIGQCGLGQAKHLIWINGHLGLPLDNQIKAARNRAQVSACVSKCHGDAVPPLIHVKARTRCPDILFWTLLDRSNHSAHAE